MGALCGTQSSSVYHSEIDIKTRRKSLSEKNLLDRNSVLKDMQQNSISNFSDDNVQEFRMLIGMKITETELWDQMFTDVDEDGSGDISRKEVFAKMDLKNHNLRLPFVARLLNYFMNNVIKDSDKTNLSIGHEKTNKILPLNKATFFLGILNFCSLPRGDYITRFIFDIYGGGATGLSANAFNTMCSEMLGEEQMVDLHGSRLVRLLEASAIEDLTQMVMAGYDEKDIADTRKSEKKHKNHKEKKSTRRKSKANTADQIDDDEIAYILENRVPLTTLMTEKSKTKIIKFSHFVKAERKLGKFTCSRSLNRSGRVCV